VREVRDAAARRGRRGGIVEVHAGVHRARRLCRCECAVDVLSSSAAYDDCALTDLNLAHGSRMGCPHAAHVWHRPHENAVGREVVPHEDGRRGRRRRGRGRHCKCGRRCGRLAAGPPSPSRRDADSLGRRRARLWPISGGGRASGVPRCRLCARVPFRARPVRYDHRALCTRTPRDAQSERRRSWCLCADAHRQHGAPSFYSPWLASV
jgi:hypothetical protein